jgi:hypothetical protein
MRLGLKLPKGLAFSRLAVTKDRFWLFPIEGSPRRAPRPPDDLLWEHLQMLQEPTP